MISYPVLATCISADESYVVRFDPADNQKNTLTVSLFGCHNKITDSTKLISSIEYNRDPIVNGNFICLKELPPYDDGDIVRYNHIDKTLVTQYSIKSENNVLFLTTHCNCNCVMCPQSQCNDKGKLYSEALQLIDMIDTPPVTITLTGGEPTFFKDRFLEVIRHLREKWINTKIVVLTNARTLSSLDFARQVVALAHGNIEFGIPLYSDSAIVHDEIVGLDRSWSQAILGLYNLASLKCCIELRVVVMESNYMRLPKLLTFIARNLPFVQRIALMGLEPMGKAREIWDCIWVDPLDAVEEIESAMQVAKRHNLNVLLYNHQLCCLPKHLRKYAVSSISDWKRTFLDACNGCVMQGDCGGFFESQNEAPYYSRIFNVQ